MCLEYLERYYFLIAFTAYLSGPAFSPGTPSHLTFAEWWHARPELRSVLERMLRRNPLAALSLDKSPDALAAGAQSLRKRCVLPKGSGSAEPGQAFFRDFGDRQPLAFRKMLIGMLPLPHAAGEAQQSAESAEQEARAALVAQRAGEVLGPHTVLMQVRECVYARVGLVCGAELAGSLQGSCLPRQLRQLSMAVASCLLAVPGSIFLL